MDLEGFEPSTFTLPAYCSTVVATGPSVEARFTTLRPRHSVVKEHPLDGRVHDLLDRSVELSSCVRPRGLEPRTWTLRGSCSAIELEALVVFALPPLDSNEDYLAPEAIVLPLHQVGRGLRLPAGSDRRSTR